MESTMTPHHSNCPKRALGRKGNIRSGEPPKGAGTTGNGYNRRRGARSGGGTGAEQGGRDAEEEHDPLEFQQ